MENKRHNNPQGLNKSRPIDGIVDSRSPMAAPARQPRVDAVTNPPPASPQVQPGYPPRESGGLPEIKQQKFARQSHRKKKRLFVAAVAFIFIAAIAIGAILFINSSKTTAPASPQTSQNDSRVSADADETKVPPAKVDSYKVAPSFPRKISIAKIGVDSRVLALGVKSNNELKAPVNIYDTGWYEGSAKPGEQGAMLLDGHVHGPTQPGVFYNLKKLVAGDVIAVERGDGTKFNYRVVSSKTYDKENVDMAVAMSPVEAGKPGLNLITCAGSFNNQADQYEDRLVGFATLQN